MGTTNLTITAGLPFNRSIRVVNGKDTWSDLSQLEYRSQLRMKQPQDSDLIATLSDWMTVSYGVDDQANDIIITWAMTGADTNAVYQTRLKMCPPTPAEPLKGYYDLILSDPGVVDQRSIPILYGIILLKSTTTKADGSR